MHYKHSAQLLLYWTLHHWTACDGWRPTSQTLLRPENNCLHISHTSELAHFSYTWFTLPVLPWLQVSLDKNQPHPTSGSAGLSTGESFLSLPLRCSSICAWVGGARLKSAHLMTPVMGRMSGLMEPHFYSSAQERNEKVELSNCPFRIPGIVACSTFDFKLIIM